MWGLEPHASFSIWMFSPWIQIVLQNLIFKLILIFTLFASIWNDCSKIFEHTPIFLWKCAISDVINGFMRNIYIDITCTCRSSLWIQAYQIYWNRTISSKVIAVYIFRIGRWGFVHPHLIFYPTAFPSYKIWSLENLNFPHSGPKMDCDTLRRQAMYGPCTVHLMRFLAYYVFSYNRRPIGAF